MSEAKRKPNVSDSKFVETCIACNSFSEVAKALNMTENNVRARHKSYNEKLSAIEGAILLPTYVATRGGNRVDVAELAEMVKAAVAAKAAAAAAE